MKSRLSGLVLVPTMVAVCVSLWAQDAPAPPAPAAPTPTEPDAAVKIGPKIQFASTEYDWGKAVYAEPVKCEFVFTNVGDEMLEVTGVHATCGCTALGEWSRQVEPGKTGRIPIQFNGLYMGWIQKTVTVTCTDTSKPSIMLHLKGTMWKRIDFPDPIKLTLIAGSSSNATATARIVNNMDEDITLSTPESNNKAITAEIKTIKPGKEFELIVTAAPPAGNNSILANLTIRTSSTNMPSFGTRAFAVVLPAVSATPNQITLPPGASATPQSYVVSIQNNADEPLVLSEAAVNAPEANVQIKEVAPGRQYTLTLTVPAGFQIAQGQTVEMSVKSSNPKQQVIKVPVYQPKPPAPPAGG